MDENQQKNIELYNNRYKNAHIHGILRKLEDLDAFLNYATITDTSWVGFYKNDLRNKIKGKKLLEMGCGDCTNAAVLAALGAEVYANDIADSSGEIIRKLNAAWSFEKPIHFIEGDFLKAEFKEIDFDYVVGKAFLHHLTEPVELQFIKKIADLLNEKGEARFFEPAVNNKFLDELRWYFPVPGRPSKFNKLAFRKWKKNDPHPERDNSSRHFKAIGTQFFKEVTIVPLGSIERFHRLLPSFLNHSSFRQEAFRIEERLPIGFNKIFARSQVIIYKNKKGSSEEAVTT